MLGEEKRESKLWKGKERKNMEFTTFTEKVKNGVQQFLGEKVEVKVRDIRKNNGVYLRGLTMFGKESNMSPTVYLNDFFEAYNRGKTLASVVRDIVEIYERSKVHCNMNLDFFSDYEKIHRQIFCKLINYEKNKEMLKEVPYIPYLDLAVVCYFAYTNEIIGNGTILIEKSHLADWGISEEEVIRRGMENTKKYLGFHCISMRDVLCDMMTQGFSLDVEELADLPDDLPEDIIKEIAGQVIDEMVEKNGRGTMYILTNKNKCLGAICMLFDSALSRMAEKTGTDFVILPSSVHETILVAAAEQPKADELRQMVAEVNESQVEPHEVLSDNVYYYDRKEHKVSIL